MSSYSDGYFVNPDGLKQHYRDYNTVGVSVGVSVGATVGVSADESSSGDFAPVVLCMPGLTRNAKDFAEVADHLSTRCRVICVEQRGRALSEWDSDPGRYQPITYVSDMMALLAHLGIDQVIALGTSLGGMMAIMMQAMHPGVFSAAIINDIGPEIDPVGLKRIQSYVGKNAPPANWEEAVEQVKKGNKGVFPEFSEQDWLEFARKLYREIDGVPTADYDPAISENLNQTQDQAAPDLWPVFAAMANIPLLVIRGELSDILSEVTLGVMSQVHPDMTAVIVPSIGHAPMLNEQEARAAIDVLVDRMIRSHAELNQASD